MATVMNPKPDPVFYYNGSIRVFSGLPTHLDKTPLHYNKIKRFSDIVIFLKEFTDNS